ncbi:TPA: peptidase domain-containing ABC transporter [Streptococcus agalactiae]
MKHIKFIQQLSETGCGIAALAMILHYHGCKIHVAELSKESNISRDGVSLKELMRLADIYGLTGKAVQLNSNEFINSISDKFPCIAVVENNHYVVIDCIRKDKITYIDPQVGQINLSIDEFNEFFSGVMVFFQKNNKFVKKKSNINRFDFLKMGLIDRKIVAIVLILSVIVQLLTLFTPWITRYIIDDVIGKNVNSNLWLMVCCSIIFVIVYGTLSYIRLKIINLFEKKYVSSLKKIIVEKVFKLPLKFFDVRSAGDMISRINGIDSLQQILTNVITSVFIDFTTVIIVAIVMLKSSIVLSSIIYFLGIVLCVFLIFFLRIVDKRNIDSILKREKTQSYLIESFSNVSVMKTLGVSQAITNKWNEYYGKQIHSEYKRENTLGFYQSFMLSYRMLPTFVVLFVGSFLINKNEMTVGEMMAFVALANVFLNPLSIIIQNIFDFQYSSTIIDRLAEIVCEDEELSCGEEIEDFKNLEFRDIGFSYAQNSGEKTISNVSFMLKKGERISFVGKTGCGKTTIVKLILSLYNPDAGDILVNSKKLKEYDLKSYRKLFGTVLQDELFFNDTLRNNIDLTRTHTDEDVKEAIKLACFDEDVNQMPFKLNTQIGDNGCNLSGGQRQRLAIARMLINRPQIVILDEGTNQLDAITEKNILGRLTEKNISLITITHRLSTVSSSDRIYFVKNGYIIDSGKYNELCNRNVECKKLFQAQ